MLEGLVELLKAHSCSESEMHTDVDGAHFIRLSEYLLKAYGHRQSEQYVRLLEGSAAVKRKTV